MKMYCIKYVVCDWFNDDNIINIFDSEEERLNWLVTNCTHRDDNSWWYNETRVEFYEEY